MKLSASNAAEYLRTRGYLSPGEGVEARELGGGVSNVVVYVERSKGEDLVIKQVCEQLRVSEPWFCSVERIWREVDVLRVCEQLTGEGCARSPLRIETPRLLFEDRENYLYAMSAAPPEHVVWKAELLSGAARTDVAASCGTLLGRLHAGTWHDAELAERLEDRRFFDDLRLDPYYRQIGRVHPDLRPAMDRLVDSVWRERHCLVHGDFSPKNLLVYGDRLMLIDFEAGHYGDPAFDLGFFLTHLMLKAYYHAPHQQAYYELTHCFWRSYRDEMLTALASDEYDALVQRGILNFAGCALARLDGKSKVDYLANEVRRDAMRRLCRTILADTPADWASVVQLADRLLPAAAVPAQNPPRQSN